MTVFPVVGLIFKFFYLFGWLGFCWFVCFSKNIPLEMYVLIKLFILTNYDVFHELDHPAGVMGLIQSQPLQEWS